MDWAVLRLGREYCLDIQQLQENYSTSVLCCRLMAPYPEILEGWTEGAVRLKSQSVCGSSPLLGGFKRVQGCWLLGFLQFTEPVCSWCHTSTEVIWFIWALMDWMLLRIFFWWPANVTPTLRMSLRRNNLSIPPQYTNKAITLILQNLLFSGYWNSSFWVSEFYMMLAP